MELDEDNFIVPNTEIEKVQMLLKGQDNMELEIPCDKAKCRFCKSHKKFCKRELREKLTQSTRKVNKNQLGNT